MADQGERKQQFQQSTERLVGQAAQTTRGMAGVARDKAQNLAGMGTSVTSQITDGTRGFFGRITDILNRIPPLKYGVYTMGVLSAIPVAIFLGFLGISFAVLCGIATVIVSLLEGGAVLVGGTFLVPTLFVAGVVTFFIVGGFLLAWVASYALARVWSLISYLFSYANEEIQGDIGAIETGAKRGLQIGRKEE